MALRPLPLFVNDYRCIAVAGTGDASAFYKKRIPSSVFFPFLIWSVIYKSVPLDNGLLGVEPRSDSVVSSPYSGEEVMPISGSEPGYIAEMPFNFSIGCTHVVYLSADRAFISIFDMSRHGGEGLRNVPTMVSAAGE